MPIMTVRQYIAYAITLDQRPTNVYEVCSHRYSAYLMPGESL